MRLDRVAKLNPAIDLIAVTATFLKSGDNACSLEIRYYVLHGSLGDSHLQGHVSQNLVLHRIETEKNMRMVRKERPVCLIFNSGGSRLFCLNSHVPERVELGGPIRASLLVVVFVTVIL